MSPGAGEVLRLPSEELLADRVGMLSWEDVPLKRYCAHDGVRLGTLRSVGDDSSRGRVGEVP